MLIGTDDGIDDLDIVAVVVVVVVAVSGANVNARDSNQNTALHVAGVAGSVSFALNLVSKTKGIQGTTPNQPLAHILDCKHMIPIQPCSLSVV
jgi:hypothetical protein